MIAGVVVDVLAKQVNRLFDYKVPEHLEKILKIGYRVKVLFGNRIVLGFVVEIKNTTSYKKNLKELLDVVDVYPVLNEEFVDLAKYIADNNFSYYATALQTMIPSALKVKYQKIAILLNTNSELEKIFKGKKEIIIDNRVKEELNIIYAEVQKGNVKLDTKFKKNRNEKLIEYAYVIDSDIVPTSKQGQNLLKYMLEINQPLPIDLLLEDSGYSKNVIKTLISKGIVGTYKKEVFTTDNEISFEYKKVILNEEQEKCYQSLKHNCFKTYLLHGITGSGKTQVYMEWIEDIIKSGKQAILLVPEISLTPQITAIFKSRFGNDVAILHSRLSIFDKYSSWKKILNGDIKIVIGARSAIFAPLNNLGIIIIDEEHESSYVQENNPRYNALDIASMRAKFHNCPLVLGSATPNVCDFHKAQIGEYELLTMTKRANLNPLPTKTIVDMAAELKMGNRSVFSKTLKDKLLQTYSKKEQSILFLNRRGHSSFVMCRSCGEVINCPHCDVSLTYHAYNNVLKCHHCGFQMSNVNACPSCNSSKIRFVGSGTEKVMEEIKSLIPEARILRVDLDTTNKVEDYEETFNTFKKHDADILVGTQMIAKGLDFANVTLVGIVNADLALHYPSYDANMKAYNLIEQVSGRAGRGDKYGEVIIQTYKPSHFVIQTASKNDYIEFYNKEMQYRKLTNMPPFSTILQIVVSSLDVNKAHMEAKNIIYALKNCSIDDEVLGPAEALPFRLNDVFRFTIQVKIKNDVVLDKIKEIYPIYQSNKDVDIKIIRM